MKRVLYISAFLVAAMPAQAACFADYKAKQDAPLRLHYGVIEIKGTCAPGAAAREIANRIAGEGWALLNVVSVFGEEGLAQRKDSAGQFYLRF